MRHLTADMIAEALEVEEVELRVQSAEGWGCEVTFIDGGGGVVEATLWDRRTDGEVESRTFRLVEVEA